MTRISVGVDVPKNRSTVCIMDQDRESHYAAVSCLAFD